MRRLILLIGGVLMTFTSASAAPAAVPLPVARRAARDYTARIRHNGWQTKLRGCPVTQLDRRAVRECTYDIPANLSDSSTGAVLSRVDVVLVLAVYRNASDMIVRVV